MAAIYKLDGWTVNHRWYESTPFRYLKHGLEFRGVWGLCSLTLSHHMLKAVLEAAAESSPYYPSHAEFEVESTQLIRVGDIWHVKPLDFTGEFHIPNKVMLLIKLEGT